MDSEQEFAEIAALIGEPARATMLWNLMDGRAYTAGELALVSNISPQSASNHLNKLLDADLLRMEKQGKHRYYRFARTEVAYAIEAISNLLPGNKKIRQEKVVNNGDIQYARTCYDHLAGKIAVDLTQSLLKQKVLTLEEDEFDITSKGVAWFNTMEIDVAELKKGKRPLSKVCLDWTERKNHLAGALGAALLDQMQAFNWIRKKTNSRIVILTAKGERELGKLGIDL